MKKIITIFLIGLIGCTSGEEQDIPKTTEDSPQSKSRVSELPEFSELIVGVDNLRLRTVPGQDGAEIARLPLSTVVKPTGNKSDFLTALTLRGLPYNEPWIEIETGQLKGWLFAGALDFDPVTSKLNKALFEQRAANLFGKNNLTKIQRHYTQVETLQKANDIQVAYDYCKQLQESLNKDLERKSDFNGQYPSMIWMEKGIPGLHPRPVAEGTRLQLFMDYGDWMSWAMETENAADERFFDFLDHVNGVESIEYSFGNYFRQMTDYEGVSSLGAGIHIKLLREAEGLYADETVFSPAVKDQVRHIIGDMLDTNNRYWNPQPAIDAELSEIISATWTVITEEEIAALKERRAAFKLHKQNGIVLNEKGS